MSPAMLAYYLHDLSRFVFEVRPGVGIYWYGLAYVLAFFAGYWLYRWLALRRLSPLQPAQVGDFITGAAVFGVMLGGRVGWILFYALAQDHAGDPWWWPFQVWKGGMSAHGGMLGLILFTFWYSRRHRVSWTGIGDNLCVVAPVGLFFGRVANFINGELWGGVTTVPWAVQFPQEMETPPPLDVLRHDETVRQLLRERLPPRHPSQLYEALLEGVLLFAVLWFLRTKTRQPRGVLTGVFFLGYAILRIFGELFRLPDPAWSMGPFSAGQFLSLILVPLGIAFIVAAKRSPQYEAANRDPHAPTRP